MSNVIRLTHPDEPEGSVEIKLPLMMDRCAQILIALDGLGFTLPDFDNKLELTGTVRDRDMKVSVEFDD